MFGVSGLTPDILLMLGIIVLTIILFVTEIVRVDVVACLVLVLLGLTKLIPSEKLFLGFSSDAVIALIGIMIIGAGLERSGVVAKIAIFTMRLGGKEETRIRLTLMGISGVCAGFLRSVGTVALLLPIVTRIQYDLGIAKARLLLPLSFCAILGSTLTLLGTGPLILLNNLLLNSGGMTDRVGDPAPLFGLFSVLPIGLALLIFGMLYFTFLSEWFLPKRETLSIKSYRGSGPAYFQGLYGIGADYCECRVPSTSALANNTIRQWEEMLPPSIAIIGLKIGNTFYMPPIRNMEVKMGSVLAMLGPRKEIANFAQKYGLRMSSCLTAFSEKLSAAQSGLCEAVVPPSSKLLGTGLNELHMRREYGIQVLAVHRGDKVYRGKKEMVGLNLRAGDALGMFCEWSALHALHHNPDFVIVTSDYPKKKLRTEKMRYALFFFILSIALIISGKLTTPVGLLVGAVGMIFSGVITIDDAYDAVSWKTIFLLAGLIPLGIAVQDTGTSDWIGKYILHFFGNAPEWILLLVLGICASIGSLFLSNVGATIVLVPLAVHLAQAVGADPRAFALMVALATSNSFLLPANQANALISTPGQYKNMDFLKAGSVISGAYLIIVMIMVSWMF